MRYAELSLETYVSSTKVFKGVLKESDWDDYNQVNVFLMQLS
jgi:hypothetical protein